jgi:pyruvate/2-oxoglutarate dehydrogenase complex dihydrolipoamide acyltransferase (E2) component
MQHKLVIPSTADGALAVTVLRWAKNVGDPVVKGEDLVELKTEKITLYVPAPCDGTLAEIRLPVGNLARVGDELGAVEES